MIILDVTIFGMGAVLYTSCGVYGRRPCSVQHYGDAA